MHLVQLVIKNASELDYSLPVLWGLSQARPDVELTVVHCVGDRRQILRDASLYSDALHALGAREIDLSELVRGAPVRAAWRWLFAKSPADEHSIRDNLAAAREAGLRTRAGRASMARGTRAVADRSRRLAQRAALRLAPIDRLLATLHPDVVLLGNRSTTDFPGRGGMFGYLGRRDDDRRWVVLVPHAADETIRDEFTPYDELGEALPSHVDYWLVLDDVETANRFPGHEHQFGHVGYPGLDPGWATWLRDLASGPASAADAPLRAVLVGRKFSAPGAPASPDPFTLSYEEMVDQVDVIARALDSAPLPVDVTVKPHPSSNMGLLTAVLEARGLHWSVSHEPAVALAASSDLFMGIFSTILVVPVGFGLPTVVIDSRVQRYVDDRWPLMSELYRGLEQFTGSAPAEVAAVVGQACEAAAKHRSVKRARPTLDEVHLSRFFPSEPMTRCLMRLEELTR